MHARIKLGFRDLFVCTVLKSKMSAISNTITVFSLWYIHNLQTRLKFVEFI